MNTLQFGLLSDIHLSGKPYRLISALRMLRDVDILLVAGDLADRGTAQQYQLLRTVFDGYPGDIPVFIVSGNHDIPGNDESNFRAFEQDMLRRARGRFDVESDPCGAYAVGLSENLDLVGLNPLYYQKMFRFPNRGEQLAFLEERLRRSGCKNHIVLCHPPLIAHNPQRTADMQPYLPKEQDARLQRIVDSNPRILFLSGHTHVVPEIETDERYGNIYINDGSVCPTRLRESQSETFPGNIVRFEAGDTFANLRAETVTAGGK